MSAYENAKKELKEKHKQECVSLKAYEPLFVLAMHYGHIFSDKTEWEYGEKTRCFDLTFALGPSTINCLALNLRLGENDSTIRDIGPIIEEMKEDPRLIFHEECEYIAIGWTGWNFKTEEGYGKPILKVRAFFENATKCRKVGTGKFEETMELICEE